MGAVAVVGVFMAGPLARAAAAQEAVYIVRHAERANDESNSPLSAEGHARADRLAGMLRDAGITDIFVSEFERTAQTVAPLASRLGIAPTAVPADDPGALLRRIRRIGPKARVLVAGHSDTVPALLKALGCKPPVTIAKAEYDNLFVVVARGTAGPACLRLRY